MSLRGLYRHTTSGKLYHVIGEGRRTDIPHKQVLIYKQIYDKTKYDIDVPTGEIWVQNKDEINFDTFIKLHQKIK